MPSRAKWKKCLQFHPLSYAFLPARVFIPWKSSAFCCGVFISTRTTFESNHKLISFVFHSNEVGGWESAYSSAVFASFGMLDCSSQGLPEAWYFFRALVSRCSRLKSSEGWNCREKYDFQRRKRSRCFEDLPIWPGPQSEGKEISLPFGEMSKGKEK